MTDTFEISPIDNHELAIQRGGEKSFQANKTVNAKALGQECDFCVPGSARWIGTYTGRMSKNSR